MNKDLKSLCLAAAAVVFIALLPSTEALPKVMIKQDFAKEIAMENDKSLADSRCFNCSTTDCPETCPPVTPPPCTDCPPIIKPPTSKYPNLPSVTYSTNCDFCDHDLYTLTCVETPFDCAARCAVDMRCSHFTYIANVKGGTCNLKKAFGSGGAWASSIPSPSPYVCGYIPKRALIGIFLNVCVGLDITGSVRSD